MGESLVNVNKLTPGMTLSKPVFIDGTKITLLDRGVTLDNDKIEMLKKIGISGAFVYGNPDTVSSRPSQPVPAASTDGAASDGISTPQPPLPLSSDSPTRPGASRTGTEDSAKPSSQSSNRDFKILVVDDEKDICVYVKDVLENYNYEVIITTSGAEAMELIKTDSNITVLFLDIMMPELNGFELLKRIRAEAKRPIQVIMVTARRTMQDVLMAKELGVIGYVTKPFDPERLVKVLENAISLRAS